MILDFASQRLGLIQRGGVRTNPDGTPQTSLLGWLGRDPETQAVLVGSGGELWGAQALKERIIAVKTDEAIQETFTQYVAYLAQFDAKALGGRTPAEQAQRNIGYCFGEGVPVEQRRRWHAVTGAVHPLLGALQAQKELSFSELVLAGIEYARREQRVNDAN